MNPRPRSRNRELEVHRRRYFLRSKSPRLIGASFSYIKLPDDTTFTIGPNSDVVIDKFVYDAGSSPKTIVANMSKGVFRWVTGKVAPKDPAAMKVTLPVGDLGIRGTDFEATVEGDGSGVVTLQFGQLEITEKKTGFKFILEAGHRVTFSADGAISRPIKME